MNSINKIYHSSECAICYEDYEKAQANECLLLKCGHVFHKNCAASWVNQQQSCPLCRSKAFTPVLLKNIVAEMVTQGRKGAKKAGTIIVYMVSIVALHILVLGTLNYFFPGRWATTDDEINAHIKEHGLPDVIFDFNKPEGFYRLGLSITTAIGIGSAYYIMKSLIQRRTQPAIIAEEINYTPPENQ